MALVKENKAGGKEGKTVNNEEKHHTCVEKRHKEMLKTVKQHRMGGKGEEAQWREVTLTSAQCIYRQNSH
jgi:hypothetical protein